MFSPCAIRYAEKTSAEARRHSVALAIAAPLAAAAIEEAFRSFFGGCEEEVCETCDKTLKPGEGKSQLTGSFSCVVCPDCYEEEDLGRCEDCCVKLSGDDKGNTKCEDCGGCEAEGQ